MPIPAGTLGCLTSVAVLPGGRAVVVGGWRPPSPSKPLIGSFDGTAWHLVIAPAVCGFSAPYSVAAPGQGPLGGRVLRHRGGVMLEFTGSWQLATPSC